MRQKSESRDWAPARLFAAALLCSCVGMAHAAATGASSPESLHAQYVALQDRLSHNAYQRPLYLDSRETPGSVAGGVYALIDHPFATVGAVLNSPGNWCDILILHFNTKYCRPSVAGQGDVLNVRIGKKDDQPVDEAFGLALAHRVAVRTAGYLKIRLSADEGPLSTRDFRIVLEAIPLENGQTFVHLSYSYTYGLVGRIAMEAYLGTAGSGKVGFTVAGTQPDGRPLHIGGMRGVVERNTMRYFLAIEAFLGALSEPPQARLEKRLHDWFAASERYARQLHEMEQGAYLEMKRREHRRQQAGRPVAGELSWAFAVPSLVEGRTLVQ